MAKGSMFHFNTPVRIRAAAGVVGKSEAEGPIGDCFDLYDKTDRFGQKTWEMAESEMQRLALRRALSKAGIGEGEVDAMMAGDLLNQCVGSAYGLLDFTIPYFGLYGACSTAVEGLLLGAVAVSSGHAACVATVTSSHNSSAERQYRYPLEYGGQRSPTAQWTVTGAGAFVLSADVGRVRLSRGMAGIVCDGGIKDVSNMGAAMAPAAADTLVRFFEATGSSPEGYDLILTGDLGHEGASILRELMLVRGYDMGDRYGDCGLLIYDREGQDMHAGGSGCGCSAVVMASYLLPRMERGCYRHVLCMGTGAMMSPASLQQGNSIPAVAHLIQWDCDGEEERV